MFGIRDVPRTGPIDGRRAAAEARPRGGPTTLPPVGNRSATDVPKVSNDRAVPSRTSPEPTDAGSPGRRRSSPSRPACRAILGLVREIVAARYFGVAGSINTFTVAFQIPNLVRALVADAALSAAFVPVFSELLEKGERVRAWRVASTLFWLVLLGLGGLTALVHPARALAHGAVRPTGTRSSSSRSRGSSSRSSSCSASPGSSSGSSTATTTSPFRRSRRSPGTS